MDIRTYFSSSSDGENVKKRPAANPRATDSQTFKRNRHANNESPSVPVSNDLRISEPASLTVEGLKPVPNDVHICNVEPEPSQSDVEVNNYSEPNQPDPQFLPVQDLSSRKLKFQRKWYKEYPWLHVNARETSASSGGVLCFYCMKMHAKGDSAFNRGIEPAFSTKGFQNWKKALQRFQSHEISKHHRAAVENFNLAKKKSIAEQLSRSYEESQAKARKCLLKLWSSLRYIARQGIAFRGHETHDGNYAQLLRLRSEDDQDLASWLTKKSPMTHHDIQNEMLDMMSVAIVKSICEDITGQDNYTYSVIVDGTQDINGNEQLAICVRYIDAQLQPNEAFVGLYEAPETTGATISKIILDVLCRLQLPISDLRGQAYDGASNMSGQYRGVQAFIKEKQPLALVVHCGAHVINLATEAACSSTDYLRNILNVVHELGLLYSRSSKFRALFANVAVRNEDGVVHTSMTPLKPLCSTRWSIRVTSVKAILSQYNLVLRSLEELLNSRQREVATKANGLLKSFQKGNTVLGLLMALDVMEPLNLLNKSLQGRQQTVAGMLKAVAAIRIAILTKRTKEGFEELFNRTGSLVEEFDLKPVVMPRIRRPPAKLSGCADNHECATVADYYRPIYFQILDTAAQQLAQRFQNESMETFKNLEDTLLSGKISDAISDYPELNKDKLNLQLQLLKEQYPGSTVQDYVDIFQKMTPEVARLLWQVERLLRLLLVIPASSCEAERSFSSLRRLKTWLRNSMTQKRLNHVAVCHVHQDKLDSLNLKKLASEFVKKNEKRERVFGTGNF